MIWVVVASAISGALVMLLIIEKYLEAHRRHEEKELNEKAKEISERIDGTSIDELVRISNAKHKPPPGNP